jgi:hypothetical protein
LDLTKTIQSLRADRDRIVEAITTLELLQQRPVVHGAASRKTGRRGRRTMGANERRQVSERMKRYWAGRKLGVELQKGRASPLTRHAANG